MKNEAVIGELRSAQSYLENAPCTAKVGASGPTLDELIRLVEEEGHSYGDDSFAHDCQSAWLHVEAAIELLKI